MLALVGVALVAPAAYADAAGISISALHNGSPVSDGAVVEGGDTFTLRVQYDNAVVPGEPVVIGPPEGVSFDESSLDASNNDAIDDISLVDGNIHITFVDPDDWDVNQGVWDLNFTFNEVENTVSQTIEWSVDGTPTSFDVIVRTPGDQEENVSDRLNKEASGNLYGAYVSVDQENQDVQFSDTITDHQIQYTLTINTDGETSRDGFTIADQLSEYLVYNEDSFSASITTWDENGWNQTTEDFDFSPSIEGNSFSSTVDIPSPSQLTINYTASINPDQVDALLAAAQESYEAMSEFPYGAFNVALDNTATLGDTEYGAEVYLGTTVEEPAGPEGPNLNDAFSKTVDIGSANIELDEESNILEPVELTYTLTADLAQWTGEAPEGQENHEDFTLDRNVVIQDTPDDYITWNTEAEDFLTIEGMELEEATDFEGDHEAFAADEYVGTYAFVGNNFYANIGQDSSTSVEIQLKGVVENIDGLAVNWTNPQGWDQYRVANRGYLYFGGEEDALNTRWTELWDRGDTSQGVNDPNAFSKQVQGSEEIEYVDQGDPVTVDYDFVVAGVDVTNSYIVDERDPNIFDFSDDAVLAEIQENISGEYAWWMPMGSEHFDVSVDEEGNLVIQLSEVGVEFVGDDVDNRLVVNVPLTTVPFDTKQTVTIENYATLYGQDDEPLYWSETTSEATSYGDEAEVRKSIRDTANQDWTQNLRVEIGEDGELVQDEYVYNLAFIPHGNYSAVTISPVLDELPDDVEFLGFVTDENVDTGADPVDGPVAIGGNLEAVYDADAHTVTVQQQEGTLLTQEPNISANVLVQVTEFEEDVPVINIFGNSSATFTPSDGYPLSVAKVDSEDDEVVIDDPDSRFNVYDENNDIVIEDAFVVDGQLRVTNDDGETTGLVVQEPGAYWVEETVAPAGYELSTDRIQVTVDEDGSSQQVTFPNTPAELTYAIGDYVWIDDNRDGVQDEDESPLEDVTVVLYDAAGEELDRTTTDDNGRYLFDELPAGDYQVQFILTEEQEELYEFTSYLSADGVAGDSDAGEDGRSGVITLGPDNEFLTSDEDYDHNTVNASEGIDPTWDAGVVVTLVPELDVAKNDDGDDVHQVEAGEHDVTVTIANNGNEALENFDFEDTTESGQDVVWNEEDLAALDELVLEPGDSYTVNGTVQIAAGETHRDNVVVDAAGVISGEPVEDEDPTTYEADPTYAIGDYVWIDDNRDGVQDEDENPLTDVTVELYTVDDDGNASDEPVTTTTTDDAGRYIFDNLDAGNYQVRFILTEEQEELYEFTTYTTGEDSTIDSDAGEDGRSGVITLGPDNEFLTSDEDYDHNTVNASEGIDPTWDAGVVETLVPELEVDKNEPGDDSQQVEAGEHEVEVTIANSGNEALENFQFEDTTESGQDVVWNDEDLATLEALVLEPGDSYTVNGTVQVAAGETHRDNVVITATGVISGDPAEDEDPTTYVADEDPTYAIGDYVWIDSNSDGVQDPGESALPEVTVELYAVDENGNVSAEPVDTTTTDEVGRYLFDELDAGEYQVRFVLTEEQAELYEFTSYTEGDDAVVDSDAGEDGRSGIIVLNDDNEFLTADEDYDYNTINASEGIDPTWDAGVVLLPEPEEPEPAVEIIKGDGDADTGTIENDADTEDEAVDYADGETREVVINVTNTGEEDLVDVVLTDETLSGAAVEGLVWTTPDGTELVAEDVDGVLTAAWDGPWAVGETLTGVASLTLAEGGELHTNTASVTATGAASGTAVEDDDPYNATPPEQPEPEEPTYAIGDYVWIDSNGDGVQDDDEDPLQGVTVVLYDSEGEEISRTTTDEDGRYIFDELDAGEYQVRFVLTEEQAELYEFTSYTSGDDVAGDSNAGENGFSSLITLGPDNEFLTSDEDYNHNTVEASEGIDPTWDAGVVLIDHPVEPTPSPTEPTEEPTDPSPTPTEPTEEPTDPSPTPTEPTEEPTDPEDPTYAIGDYVWIDSNGDGVQDEDPLEGVTVILFDSEGNELARTTTDDGGRYIFDELPAGDYQVQFELTDEQAERYGFTSKHSGDVALDSDANPATGLTPVFSLGEDSPGLTQDYDREFLATNGIDPTWDAGVVVIEEAEAPTEEPTDPAPAEEPTDPAPTSEPTETPADPAATDESAEPSSEATEVTEPTEEPSASSAEPTASPAAENPQAEDEDDSSLARTGATVAGVLAASLLLLVGGLLLRQRTNRRQNTEF